MKIICATLNSKYIHSSLSPWCLKAGVDKFCNQKHFVEVLEYTINGQVDQFVTEISEKSPDVLALSCYIWNIEYILELCKILKSKAELTIILGGPEASNRYTDLLTNYAFIDFILIGEGEWSFSSFINTVSNNESLEECEGLCYRNDNDIICIPNKIHNETPPSPYCDEYFSQLHNRIAYIESSRGCPFRCSYCLSGTLTKMRCFELNQVFSDIVKLSHSGTRTIKFIDRTFNADSRHCNAILNFIKNEYGKSISDSVCFHFEISGDLLTSETIEILRKMPKGLCQLEIGIQSFNPITLNAISRHCNLQSLEANIRELLSEDNIHIHIDLIAGLPYEDLESFKSTFNRAYKLYCHMLQLGFLKLLHGADLNKDISKFDYVFNTTPPYEIKENLWLSSAKLKKIECCERALEKLYNSGRFHMTLNYLINEIGIAPFDLFCSFSEGNELSNISLSELTRCLYLHFQDFCEKERLRECILCDIVCIDANIRIPDELKCYSKNYKKFKKMFAEKYHCNIKLVECNSINKVYVVKTNSPKNLFGRRNGEFFTI